MTRRRDPYAIGYHRWRHIDGKTIFFAQLFQNVDIAFFTFAERVVVPHDNFFHPKTVYELLNKLSGVHSGKVDIKVSADRNIDTV